MSLHPLFWPHEVFTTLSGDNQSLELRNMVNKQVDGNVSLWKKFPWLGRAVQADRSSPDTAKVSTLTVLGIEETF